MVGKELYVEVERIVDGGKYGYASVSEFVKEAVRRRLEEIAKLKETSSTKILIARS
jgi:Arc/MetJ-type ribon-helix-helix transcriptional regulator